MVRLLVLVPTKYELDQLRPRTPQAVHDAGGLFEICGFGVIASGISAARLLAHHAPETVILAGIAGALTPHLPIGTAATFFKIGCYGIGAGSGSEYRTASELGWPQWTDPENGQAYGDIIHLHGGPSRCDPASPALLTVCAASANSADVADRIRTFPDAVAEDMEAFSVAAACQMAQTPLAVIRGISNIAGDRDKSRWDVPAAMEAVANLISARILQ